MHTHERLRSILDRIIEGYDKLKEFELQGSTHEQLRSELINIRDTCEEIPALLGIVFKESNLDVSKVIPFANLFKVDFLPVIKTQIMLLSDQNPPNSEGWLKMQANMSVTIMNMNGTIDYYRLFSKILS